MDALQLFLIEHARAHSKSVAPDAGPVWLEDAVFTGLTDDQCRRPPPGGGNYLAWLLWHIARIEDLATNVVVAAGGQVLDEGGWHQRLNVDHLGVGTGMTTADAADLATQIDIPALRAYRAAVGRRTQGLVADLVPEQLALPITAIDVERAVAVGSLGAQAEWFKSFWVGRSKAWYLSWTAVGHSYLHLGEAMAVKGRLPIGCD